MLKKSNPMNVTLLKSNALSFLRASNRCLEQRQLAQNQIQFLIIPAVVNLAFSIELSMKYIIISNGEIARGHDLNKLFKKINDPLKTEIISKTSYTDADFNSLLDSHSELFVEWRYLHEKDEGNLDLKFLQECARSFEHYLEAN
jgi:hypothetical protein